MVKSASVHAESFLTFLSKSLNVKDVILKCHKSNVYGILTGHSLWTFFGTCNDLSLHRSVSKNHQFRIKNGLYNKRKLLYFLAPAQAMKLCKKHEFYERFCTVINYCMVPKGFTNRDQSRSRIRWIYATWA